jgi:antitoxin component of MazEF toxin-antitoxin module
MTMEIVKIRRVGNSNVLSVPRAFADAGYDAGQPVVIEQLENGDLLVRRVESHRALIRATMQSIAQEHRQALDMLAPHDGRVASPAGDDTASDVPNPSKP